MIARVSLSLVLLSACARSIAPEEEDADAGGGGGIDGVVCEAAIDDCQFGLFFAVCGESGGPTLACADSSGHCRWFVGGCAVGYEPSDCPTDDLCCHTTADGRWPFVEWEPSSGMAKQEMMFDLGAIGGLVTASSPAEIVVHVDPSIGEPDSRRAVCSPGAELQICEDAELADVLVSPRAYDLSRVLRFTRHSLFGESLTIELVPQPDGTTIARAFVHEFTDFAPPDLPTACPDLRRISASGTLTVTTTDFDARDTVHGTLDLTLTSGATVTLSF